MRPLLYSLSLILSFLGIALLWLNLLGLITPLHNHNAHHKQPAGFSTEPLPSEEAASRINAVYTSPQEAVTMLTELIHRNIAHFWPTDDLDSYNIRISWRENYLLRFAAYIRPDIFERYEFCGYKKALERGVGLCSQQALALTRLLNIKGITTHVVGLNGHVLTTTLINPETNEWWLADPDYEVIIPHSLSVVETKPEIIRVAYASRGYDEETIERLLSYYQTKDNIIYPPDVQGYPDCPRAKIYFRKASYWLKWLIPFILILPMIIIRYKYAAVATPDHKS